MIRQRVLKIKDWFYFKDDFEGAKRYYSVALELAKEEKKSATLHVSSSRPKRDRFIFRWLCDIFLWLL